MIFPHNDLTTSEDESMYIRTHHSYPPGEQLQRNYNWPIDPNSVRFGIGGLIEKSASNLMRDSRNVTQILKPVNGFVPTSQVMKRIRFSLYLNSSFILNSFLASR